MIYSHVLSFDFIVRISSCQCSCNVPRFHQAYTQVIEDTAKDSFDMLGIRFIANNYAIGKCIRD
jgi:hypothetical protein